MAMVNEISWEMLLMHYLNRLHKVLSRVIYNSKIYTSFKVKFFNVVSELVCLNGPERNATKTSKLD